MMNGRENSPMHMRNGMGNDRGGHVSIPLRFTSGGGGLMQNFTCVLFMYVICSIAR